MSNLAEAVQRSLSEWKPAGDGRHTLAQAYPDAGWNLAATFEKVESVGGSVWELALDRTGAVPASLTLKAWAERVANQVSGMLERLKVYEIDDANGVALLRSDGPQARGTIRSYYEVALNGVSNATLRRFHADTTPGTKREQVAFALTYESIGQVVEGLTA
jgi:hypothetical protein